MRCFSCELVHGGELVPQARGGFELLGFGGGHHARGEGALKLGVAALEKELRVANGLLVDLGRGEALDAGAEAAMNVVLQAGAGMVAREVDLATGQQKAAVNEFDHAVGEVAGKVGAVVGGAVFAQSARDEDLGEAVGEGELDVRVGLIVAQQDVEARLALLDEVVLESKGLMLVGDENVLDIDGLSHERAGFGVGLRRFKQIRADAGAQVFGLADIDHFAFCVLVEIHPGLGGKCADFLVEVHKSGGSLGSGRAGGPISRIAGIEGRPQMGGIAQARAKRRERNRAILTGFGKNYTKVG